LSAEEEKVGGLIMWLALLKTGFPIAMQSCPDAPGQLTIPDTWADHNRPPAIKYNVTKHYLPGAVCDISFQRHNAQGYRMMDPRAGARYHIITWINGKKEKEEIAATSHEKDEPETTASGGRALGG